ncbi:MAG: cation:proton antiporter [Planctomycetota bacterium]|jgi:Kef-type K+ transport system membrane component KefB
MNVFLSISIVLAGALIFASVIRRLKLPEVTAFLILGIILGPHLLHLLSKEIYEMSSMISLIALGVIAFMLGENLSLEKLKRTGRSILWISVFETVGVCILVTVVICFVLHQPFYVAVLLGAIATATAPAATMLVVREYRCKGTFTDTLLGIVAIDDAWSIIIFTICLSIARLTGVSETNTHQTIHVLINSLFEIAGSLLLGGLVAVATSRSSGFVSDNAHRLVLIICGIFFVIGVSLYLELSVLLSNVALGATLVNIDKKAPAFFETLREVDEPIYIMFFVLAGAHFDILSLGQVGVIGFAYILCRFTGRILAASAGAHMAGSDIRVKKYMGLALLPQAGVALGMALVVGHEIPQAARIVFNVTVATTVFFEILGPLCTRYALSKAGEVGQQRSRLWAQNQ